MKLKSVLPFLLISSVLVSCKKEKGITVVCNYSPSFQVFPKNYSFPPDTAPMMLYLADTGKQNYVDSFRLNDKISLTRLQNGDTKPAILINNDDEIYFRKKDFTNYKLIFTYKQYTDTISNLTWETTKYKGQCASYFNIQFAHNGQLKNLETDTITIFE